MQPLKKDLSVFKKFDFDNPPVGVKFLFNRPEGMQQLDKSISICEMIKEAQKKRNPLLHFQGQRRVLWGDNTGDDGCTALR